MMLNLKVAVKVAVVAVQPAPLTGRLALLNDKVLKSSKLPLMAAGPAGAAVIRQPGRAVDFKVAPALEIVTFRLSPELGSVWVSSPAAVESMNVSCQGPLVLFIVIVSVPPALSVQPLKLAAMFIGPSPDAGVVPDMVTFLQVTVIGRPLITSFRVKFVDVAVKKVLGGLMLSSVSP